jgi:hypothetical protein
MKNYIIVFLVFSNFCFGQVYTNFKEAQKIALGENKFMLVDFYNDCKGMDKRNWEHPTIVALLKNFVFVKIDFLKNRDLGNFYDIQNNPNVLDGNGKLLLRIYESINSIKNGLEKYSLTTEYQSQELINYYKNKNFTTSICVYQKYLDYYLLVDKELQYNFLKLGEAYFEDAKNSLSKKDENYLEKKQKLDLFALFTYAYQNKFKKLDTKLSDFKEAEILENNLNLYYFLIYISAKAQHKEDFAAVEAKVASLEGFESFIVKANFILNKYVLKE